VSKQSLLPYRSECSFIVLGKAVPRGSVKAIPRGRDIKEINGRRYREDKGTLVIDQDSAVLKSWMQDIKTTAIREWALEHIGYSARPFKIDITFRLDRPKSHYGSGRNSAIIKDSAPDYPIVRPDLDKLTRSINDALTRIVFKDDSQVVDMHIKKIYGYPEAIKVKIYEL